MYLEVQEVSRHFYVNGRKITAAERVSVKIPEGECVGLLGKSGSGKTTLGQIIAGLQKADEGRILADGREVHFPYRGPLRKKIQILFQQPEASFNPRRTLWESLREPYLLYKLPVTRSSISESLALFGLYPEHLDRYPRELSGGELQRAALARILVLEPELIILDEPTSMLDSISQAQMMHMLEKIRDKRQISYLFITHDEELARCFFGRLYRMENGKLKEEEG